MSWAKLTVLLALSVCVCTLALVLIQYSGRAKSDREMLARFEGLADVVAQQTNLLKEETAAVAQDAALIGHLSAELKKQEQAAGDRIEALKAALATEQQARELALRKAAEANAAAFEAQKAEIAKLKEQFAERPARPAETVKAREFQLVDAHGRSRVSLHVLEAPGTDDRPALEFFDPRGENVASYNADGVFLTQNAPGNRERASFWTGGVSISRNSHNVRLCATETSSFLNLDDRAALMAAEAGADLTLNDSNGAHRAAVSVSNRDGPSVMLMDPAMKPRITLDARKPASAVNPSDVLPGLLMMDAGGKLRVGLGCGSWSGAKATAPAGAVDFSLALFGRDGAAAYKAP
jgi:hypothetical protein